MLSREVTKMYLQNGCPTLKNQKCSSVSILTSVSGFMRRINPSLGLSSSISLKVFFHHDLGQVSYFGFVFPSVSESSSTSPLWEGAAEVGTAGLQRETGGVGRDPTRNAA